METEADLSEHSYCFAVPCYEGKLYTETCGSLLRVCNKLSAYGIKHSFLVIRGGALIHNVRNELTHRFLHETECDTMICVDADVEFDFEAFERLATFSHHYPIVAGCYPSRTDPPTFFVNYVENKLNKDGLIPVDGTGMGFVAIQREVFNKLDVVEYRNKQYDKPIKAFFQMGIVDGESRGEDIWFFEEAHKQGITTYIDPGINLKHHGSKCYDAKLQDCIHQILTKE